MVKVDFCVEVKGLLWFFRCSGVLLMVVDSCGCMKLLMLLGRLEMKGRLICSVVMLMFLLLILFLKWICLFCSCMLVSEKCVWFLFLGCVVR